MVLLLAEVWTFQTCLKSIFLQVLKLQPVVLFIGSDAHRGDLVGVTPEGTAVKAVETLGALFVTISTLIAQQQRWILCRPTHQRNL